LSKYNLPSHSALENNYAKYLKKQENSNKNIPHLDTIFDIELCKWQELAPIYRNRFLNDDELKNFCRTFLAIQLCIELNQIGYSLKQLYNSYCKQSDLVFSSMNYASFFKKIRAAEKANSIEDVLFHGLIGKPGNRAMVNADVLIEIKKHFALGNKYNSNQILEKVNQYLIRTGRKTISLSTIKKYIAQLDTKNETLLGRYGKDKFDDALLPSLTYLPPSKPDLLWQIDRTRLQFAYIDENNQIKYLTYFVVIDGNSKEILGQSYGNSENGLMALKAIERAVKKTDNLPNYINADKSPAYRLSKFQNFITSIKILGVTWQNVHHPKSNSYIERFFATFQESFCKKVPGYLGDGIKSRNRSGKPSPEILKKALSKNNLKSRSQLIREIDEQINNYNSSKSRIKLKSRDQFQHALNKNTKKLIP